jgi:hypothetical protein
MSTEMNVFEEMDVAGAGGYVKFISGEEKILKIINDPIKEIATFKRPDGSEKTQDAFVMEVLVDEGTNIMKWSITSKSLINQVRAIMKNQGLKVLAGAILRVSATGEGKDRTYFVKLISKPTKESGANWIEEQKVGAK